MASSCGYRWLIEPVTSELAGSKLAKASELGVKVLDEAQFLDQLKAYGIDL